MPYDKIMKENNHIYDRPILKQASKSINTMYNPKIQTQVLKTEGNLQVHIKIMMIYHYNVVYMQSLDNVYAKLNN